MDFLALSAHWLAEVSACMYAASSWAALVRHGYKLLVGSVSAGAILYLWWSSLLYFVSNTSTLSLGTFPTRWWGTFRLFSAQSTSTRRFTFLTVLGTLSVHIWLIVGMGTTATSTRRSSVWS